MTLRKFFAASAAAAFALSLAAPAAADDPAIFAATIREVGSKSREIGIIENSGIPGTPGAFAEVGSYTYVETLGPDFIVEDLQEMQGVLHMRTIGDFGATPLTSLYLTFDIAAAGGVHPTQDFCCDISHQGNVDQPFTGQIRLSYAINDDFFLGDIAGPITTLATFDISPAWADVGETFSFDIFDLVGASQPAVGTDFTLLLEQVGPYQGTNKAWTFNNFRLTDADQTTALPPTTTVPEPGSWALMILGFGAAGAALRRRAMLAT